MGMQFSKGDVFYLLLSLGMQCFHLPQSHSFACASERGFFFTSRVFSESCRHSLAMSCGIDSLRCLLHQDRKELITLLFMKVHQETFPSAVDLLFLLAQSGRSGDASLSQKFNRLGKAPATANVLKRNSWQFVKQQYSFDPCAFRPNTFIWIKAFS